MEANTALPEKVYFSALPEVGSAFRGKVDSRGIEYDQHPLSSVDFRVLWPLFEPWELGQAPQVSKPGHGGRRAALPQLPGRARDGTVLKAPKRPEMPPKSARVADGTALGATPGGPSNAAEQTAAARTPLIQSAGVLLSSSRLDAAPTGAQAPPQISRSGVLISSSGMLGAATQGGVKRPREDVAAAEALEDAAVRISALASKLASGATNS